MTTAEANLVLAVITWTLALAIGLSHVRERGWRHIPALLGSFVFVSATLLVVTAMGGVLDISTEVLRVVAAFLRGVLLALVAGYAWDRWMRHH